MRLVLLFSCLAIGCAEPVIRSGDGIAPRDLAVALSQACIDRPTPTNRAALADLSADYPESPDIHVLRGGCEMGAATSGAVSRDPSGRAEALRQSHDSYSQAIALADAGRPSSHTLATMLTTRYIVRSIQAVDAGEPYYWAPALEDIDRAIALEPETLEAALRHADRAAIQAQLGDAAQMIADLDRANALAGSDPETLAHIENVREVEGVKALLVAAGR